MVSCCRGKSDRRLVARSLWFVCCTACVSSLLVVFLSVQCLEDHREGKGVAEEMTTGSSSGRWSSHRVGSREARFNGVLKENRELRRIVRQLRITRRPAKPAAAVDDDARRSGILRGEDDGVRLWQERSLKFVAHAEGKSPRNSVAASRDVALNCEDVARIRIGREIGRGYTKVTQHGIYKGSEVAVKSAGLDSTDVQRCVREGRAKVVEDCLLFSRYKIMKELLLYQQLHHPNIVKLLGYCMQSDKDTSDIKSRGLTVVTELGTPVDLMAVLQMSWHQRFRIAVGLAKLFRFFSVSPLGSLVMRDFQLIQFVLVDGEIKLSDMDDVSSEPQLCHSSNDCSLANEEYNTTLECSRNRCRGYNEKRNIYNFNRFYLSSFLLPGAPKYVRVDLQKIVNKAALLDTDCKTLVGDLERVLIKLRTGEGLHSIIRNDVKYEVIPRADFPGLHDYQCTMTQSISAVNCHFLAFDETEAKQRCNEDSQCKAFVLSYIKTWTGYRSVYLKNNTSGLVFSENNMAYIKVT